MFWAKSGKGYTSDLSEAAVYTQAQAVAQHQSRVSDIPWPTAYLLQKTRQVVDFQYVRQSAVVSDTPCYLQDSCITVGNELTFVASTCEGRTDNILNARVYSKEDALAEQRRCGSMVPWPKMYLDQMTRTAVDFRFVRLEDALANTGIVLQKLKPLRRPRYQCGGCGVFMSQQGFYAGTCIRCGVANRS
jgi:hypothetical protein